MRQRFWLSCALVFACLPGCANEIDPDTGAFADGPDSIGGTDQHTALIAEGATPGDLKAAAREFCGDKQWCQVMGWREDSNRPRAMPMVDRESDSIAFSYLINRSTSHEKTMWDCGIWDGPPEVCLEPSEA